MDNINSPDEMMQYVADTARKAVESRFTNKKNELKVIEKLEELVFLVTGKHAEKGSLGFELSTDGQNELVPKNLYTLLVMNSIFVDYEKVKDETDYITECGTHYTFSPKTTIQYVRYKNCSIEKVNYKI